MYISLGHNITLLAAGKLGWLYHNLIIQQLMTLGGPATIPTVRLFSSRLIYYVHSQAINQEVRHLQSVFNSKQLLFLFKVEGKCLSQPVCELLYYIRLTGHGCRVGTNAIILGFSILGMITFTFKEC